MLGLENVLIRPSLVDDLCRAWELKSYVVGTTQYLMPTARLEVLGRYVFIVSSSPSAFKDKKEITTKVFGRWKGGAWVKDAAPMDKDMPEEPVSLVAAMAGRPLGPWQNTARDHPAPVKRYGPDDRKRDRELYTAGDKMLDAALRNAVIAIALASFALGLMLPRLFSLFFGG